MPKQDTQQTTSRMAKRSKDSGFVPRKKRSGGHHDDNDSVDSKGNLKGFVDYSYDSEDSYTTNDSSEYTTSSGSRLTPKSPIARRTRSSANTTKRNSSKSKQSSRRKTYISSDSESSEDEIESKLVAKLRKETQRLKKRIRSMEEEEDDEEEEVYSSPKRSSKKHRRLRKQVESDEDETDDEEDEEDYDEDDDDEDEEDEDGTVETDEEDDDDDSGLPQNGFVLSFGMGDEVAKRLIPQRHNMKKESPEVRKFVKLLTTPSEEDTIDGQIDQFKALPEDKRTKLLQVLESKHHNPAQGNIQQSLMFKILTMNLPTETQSLVLTKYNSLQNLDPGSSEYYKLRNWLDKLTSMPLGIYKDLPVKLSDGSETCGSFMERARKHLDDAIYGQDEAKLQILQFIATKIANPSGRGTSLLLAGPPGIGKTSLIKNGVAKALQWPFQFISLGGDSDASTYTGHQVVYEGSHCGKIVNSLCAAKSMSMILMFDEVDKISSTPKGEEVQNLLIHLTDPVQNSDFEDKYLSGIPIDLGRVMFTFSANYLEKIDRVLLDRMLVVQLQGYSVKEKIAIAEQYLLPAALKEVDLAEKVGVGKDVMAHVLEHYANEEVGVRELKRCLEQVAQKINMLRMFNHKDLPFHVKDFTLPFVLKKEHIDLFLKKKPINDSHKHMYT
jgi:hypothetical protein